MNYLYIIIFIFFITCNGSKYRFSHKIKTKFTDQDEFFKFVKKPYFFNKYLDLVKANNPIFNPEINNNRSLIEYPLSIKYRSIPKIGFLPFSLGEIDITQTWDKKGDCLIGKITCNLLTFNLTIEPTKNNNHIYLNINADVLKKKFLVPNKALNSIVLDFSNLFLIITETTI
jgi:hypothetical protein